MQIADGISVIGRGLFIWSSILMDRRYGRIKLPISVSAEDMVDGGERAGV